MEVKLIAMTRPVGTESDSPIDVVEKAASVCYDSEPSKTGRIAKACAKSGHMSVWEHISFTFLITGVSRACTHQLVRHRHGSYSQRSQRYCKEEGFEYVYPRCSTQEQIDLFADAMEDAAATYGSLLRTGMEPEDARGVLPNACTSMIAVTMNARALVEAGYERLCIRAQKEIRQMFQKMKQELRTYCPEVADMMVPKCEKFSIPYCPEKKKNCRHPSLEELVGEVR